MISLLPPPISSTAGVKKLALNGVSAGGSENIKTEISFSGSQFIHGNGFHTYDGTLPDPNAISFASYHELSVYATYTPTATGRTQVSSRSASSNRAVHTTRNVVTARSSI